MFTTKTLWKMWYAFFWTVMACGLVYPSYTFIKSAREAAQKGEATATFWLPKDVQIETDPELWRSCLRKLEEKDSFHKIQMGIGEYKRLFCEGKHLVLLLPGNVTYATFVGPIIVSAEEALNYPSFVSIKTYKHMGEGRVKFELTGGVNYIGAVVTGLLCGLLLDFLILVVIGVCWGIGTLIEEKIKGFS